MVKKELNENDLLTLRSFVNTVEILKDGISNYSMTNVPRSFDVDAYRREDNSIMDNLVERGIVATLRQLTEDNPSNVTFERVCNILSRFYRSLDDKEAIEIIREYKKGWQLYLNKEMSISRLVASPYIRTNRDLIKFLSYSGGIHTDFHNGSYTEREEIESTERFKFLKVQLVVIATTAADLSNAFIKDFPEAFSTR